MAKPDRKFPLSPQFREDRLAKKGCICLAEFNATIQEWVVADAVIGVGIVVKEPINMI